MRRIQHLEIHGEDLYWFLCGINFMSAVYQMEGDTPIMWKDYCAGIKEIPVDKIARFVSSLTYHNDVDREIKEQVVNDLIKNMFDNYQVQFDA